jgi:hypothetical protein
MPGDASNETCSVAEFGDRVRKSERVGHEDGSDELEPFSSTRFSELVTALESMAKPALNT